MVLEVVMNTIIVAGLTAAIVGIGVSIAISTMFKFDSPDFKEGEATAIVEEMVSQSRYRSNSQALRGCEELYSTNAGVYKEIYEGNGFWLVVYTNPKSRLAGGFAGNWRILEDGNTLLTINARCPTLRFWSPQLFAN